MTPCFLRAQGKRQGWSETVQKVCVKNKTAGGWALDGRESLTRLQGLYLDICQGVQRTMTMMIEEDKQSSRGGKSRTPIVRFNRTHQPAKCCFWVSGSYWPLLLQGIHLTLPLCTSHFPHQIQRLLQARQMSGGKA